MRSLFCSLFAIGLVGSPLLWSQEPAPFKLTDDEKRKVIELLKYAHENKPAK